MCAVLRLALDAGDGRWIPAACAPAADLARAQSESGQSGRIEPEPMKILWCKFGGLHSIRRASSFRIER